MTSIADAACCILVTRLLSTDKLMGRRALHSPDRTLDLSHHLKTFDDLPCPWDVAKLFAGGGPLEIEIGSGKGLFMQRAAAQFPDRNFLGIEIARKYAHFAATRLAKRKLDNAIIVSGDALRIFRETLPDQSCSAVHVYFPDPWWKKRHRKRRVMTEQFLADVQRTLLTGGVLHFWTDVQDYFDESLALISKTTQFSGPSWPAELPATHDLDYHTHFERRMRLNEQTVYRANFLKGAKRPADQH